MARMASPVRGPAPCPARVTGRSAAMTTRPQEAGPALTIPRRPTPRLLATPRRPTPRPLGTPRPLTTPRLLGTPHPLTTPRLLATARRPIRTGLRPMAQSSARAATCLTPRATASLLTHPVTAFLLTHPATACPPVLVMQREIRRQVRARTLVVTTAALRTSLVRTATRLQKAPMGRRTIRLHGVHPQTPPVMSATQHGSKAARPALEHRWRRPLATTRALMRAATREPFPQVRPPPRHTHPPQVPPPPRHPPPPHGPPPPR